MVISFSLLLSYCSVYFPSWMFNGRIANFYCSLSRRLMRSSSSLKAIRCESLTSFRCSCLGPEFASYLRNIVAYSLYQYRHALKMWEILLHALSILHSLDGQFNWLMWFCSPADWWNLYPILHFQHFAIVYSKREETFNRNQWDRTGTEI